MTAQPVETERPALRLRAWQAEALARYRENTPADFLVTATPGAGKTSFALALASDLLGKRVIDRVIVVAPTDHLRTQWAVAADRLGLRLDPTLGNDTGPAHLIAAVGCPTVVVFSDASNPIHSTGPRVLIHHRPDFADIDSTGVIEALDRARTLGGS